MQDWFHLGDVMEKTPGRDSHPLGKAEWAPLSATAYPWCLATVRVYTRAIVPRQVLGHRVLTPQEQGRRMKEDPACKPPRPPLFDLGSPEQVAALEPDRRLLLQLEAHSHAYHARLQHFQAMQEVRIQQENQTEFVESWVPFGYQSKPGAESGKQARDGVIVILCSPSTLATFFRTAQEGLVLLASVQRLATGPKGTQWRIDADRVVPLLQPHVRPHVFLPLNEPPTFPLEGEGDRRKLVNEAYQSGGLWTPLHLSESYDPIRDGV